MNSLTLLEVVLLLTKSFLPLGSKEQYPRPSGSGLITVKLSCQFP